MILAGLWLLLIFWFVFLLIIYFHCSKEPHTKISDIDDNTMRSSKSQRNYNPTDLSRQNVAQLMENQERIESEYALGNGEKAAHLKNNEFIKEQVLNMHNIDFSDSGSAKEGGEQVSLKADKIRNKSGQSYIDSFLLGDKSHPSHNKFVLPQDNLSRGGPFDHQISKSITNHEALGSPSFANPSKSEGFSLN